jgi:pyruvate-formate lyase
MEGLRRELTDYYQPWQLRHWAALPESALTVRREILATMDAYAAAHPDEHPSLLKARLHEEMAAQFEPVLFPHSPFFFEMGLRFAENWGNPHSAECVVGSWLLQRRQPLTHSRPEWGYLRACQQMDGTSISLWNAWNGFDTDHHCLGYTKLLTVGLTGLLAEIADRQQAPCTPAQAANLEAMTRSIHAMLRVAERFGAEARRMLALETDPDARRCLEMITEATTRVPAHPPRTFYEGLAMLWFLREATATLEAIGISVIGHLDRVLYPLYAADLAAGRLTREDAADLLARWMLPTDCKFHVADSSWPETSTCMELGGCDEDGTPVWNDLTRLIIETHHRHRLMNPKLNCRYSAQSPQAYLDLISATILAGHNQFALLNDDILIPTFVRAGKTEREARLYVNGGCQEPMVEGVEHTAGAYFYFCLPRVLDLNLRPMEEVPADLPAPVRTLIPAVLPEVDTFEEFYRQFMDGLIATIRTGTEWLGVLGREHWQLHPCPFFSTSLTGCIDAGMDYTQGGAKYNPSGIALIGLGTTIDSLYAIKRAVYEERWLTLAELRVALAADWEGAEALRARILQLPRFGHGEPEIDALAAEFSRELAAAIRTMPSERGGVFQASFFVYYAFSWFAKAVRATPDGRRTGELLSQGIAPARQTASPNLPDVFHSLSTIDFCDHPGNAVLDIQLPAGKIPVEALTATLRTFADLGGPTLQLNCVSLDRLRDAQLHPDRHRDLTVRICGLSAHFVALTPAVQEEIITRAMMAV